MTGLIIICIALLALIILLISYARSLCNEIEFWTDAWEQVDQDWYETVCEWQQTQKELAKYKERYGELQ